MRERAKCGVATAPKRRVRSTKERGLEPTLCVPQPTNPPRHCPPCNGRTLLRPMPLFLPPATRLLLVVGIHRQLVWMGATGVRWALVTHVSRGANPSRASTRARVLIGVCEHRCLRLIVGSGGEIIELFVLFSLCHDYVVLSAEAEDRCKHDAYIMPSKSRGEQGLSCSTEPPITDSTWP